MAPHPALCAYCSPAMWPGNGCDGLRKGHGEAVCPLGTHVCKRSSSRGGIRTNLHSCFPVRAACLWSQSSIALSESSQSKGANVPLATRSCTASHGIILALPLASCAHWMKQGTEQRNCTPASLSAGKCWQQRISAACTPAYAQQANACRGTLSRAPRLCFYSPQSRPLV